MSLWRFSAPEWPTHVSRSDTVLKLDLRGSCPSFVLAQQIKEEE
jgi:hypothetical protein